MYKQSIRIFGLPENVSNDAHFIIDKWTTVCVRWGVEVNALLTLFC